MSRALATSAVLLSIAAIALSGYAVYKVDQLEHSQGALALVALAKGEQKSTNSQDTVEKPAQGTSSETMPEADNRQAEPSDIAPVTPTPSDPQPVSISASGEKAKLAKGIGEVEVVSIKRIADPYTKKRNVVNAQLRFRRDKNSPRDLAYDFRYVNMSKATLRDPETSQVFKLWRGQDDAGHVETQHSDPINLEKIAPGSSADAYAWFTVPTTVKKLNLYVPHASALENLTIQE